MGSFSEAAKLYQGIIQEHECSGDDNCQVPSGFYLMAVRGEDGQLSIWTGGHRADPADMAESMVSSIDAIIAHRSEEPPLESFMTSRDIVHSAADSVTPPPDVAAALNEFVMRDDNE